MSKSIIKFGQAIKSIDDLSKKDYIAIKQMYLYAADRVRKKMIALNLPDTDLSVTSSLQLLRLQDLVDSIEEEFRQIAYKTQNVISSSIETAAGFTVAEITEWLSKVDVGLAEAYAAVPTKVVANIMSGKLYANNWKFSQAIWGDYNKSKGDLMNIVSNGMLQGKSLFEISKDLELYVSPNAKKPFNWSKLYPGTKKVIDYNAQRLARTLITHAYEQSVAEIAKNNPFSAGVQWISAFTHTTCELCESRHGRIYAPEELPLDHPNGKCSFAVVLNNSLDEIGDELANWVHGEENPVLDAYAEYLGF